MKYKVVIATRQSEDQPWDYSVPVALFEDEYRAVRFAKSEVRDGWDKIRVRVYKGRKQLWPK